MDLTSSPAPQETTGDVPVDQIAELPPIRAVLEGKPAAVWAPEGINTPETQIIGRNLKKVGELGLALYRSPNKKMVLFNPALLPPADLKAADAAGKLDEVAAPLESFSAAPATEAPAPGAEQPAPGAQQPVTSGLAPRAQSKLAGTRLKALMDEEEPSKRTVPGGGKILNSLFSRAA